MREHRSVWINRISMDQHWSIYQRSMRKIDMKDFSIMKTCWAVWIVVSGAMAALGAPGASYYSVLDYGAIGDGKTLCTRAIQRAVDECAMAGGGKVIVPTGKFLTGPIFLKSHINFEITAGATLLGHENIDDYPAVEGRWEGIERQVYASMFTGHDLKNVSITGRGTIDAQGEVWWKAHARNRELRRKHGIFGREPDNPPDSPLKWPRPRVINLYRCKNVLIRDITILDSPAWTVHPVYCEDVTVDNITIIQPYESPNTDGVNPDSCKNVRISNCYIDVGDDCITIKSGYNQDGRRVGIPCENIVVTNCTFVHGRGGIVIGSEMSGDVRNVAVSNCVFDGTLRGLRVKTGPGRGGVVENLRATNCIMRNIQDAAFSVTMAYGGRRRGVIPEVTEETPTFRNIHWSNITVFNSNKTADISGMPEMPLQNFSLTNIHVVSAKKGIECSMARGIVFDNVIVNTQSGPALMVDNVSDLEIRRFTTHKPNDKTPVIVFENVKGALVQDCSAVAGTGTFLALKGDANAEIEMRLNRLSKAKIEMEE